MAGAVSAGAYTAGVIDFLIEALSEWQKAKDKGEDDVPMHEVCIAAMSGASAGGITAALSVLAAGSGINMRELPAVNIPAGSDPNRKVKCVLPTLYESWVKRPQLFSGSGGGAAMLGVDDLKEPGLRSLLDCALLDDIANATLKALNPPAQRQAFFKEPLHVFLTLTNLDGMHYRVGSERMIVHSDRAHFAFEGIGRKLAAHSEKSWLDIWKDSGTKLDLSARLSDDQKASLREAVLATGAFPFGLRPRTIGSLATDHENRAWPIDFAGAWEDRPVKPRWPSEAYDVKTGRLNFVTVDGGAIDNEPFSYARYAIRDMATPQNPRESTKADRAVVMIDPFPDLPALDFKRLEGDRKTDVSLPFVLGALLPALVNQARFNLKDLLEADNPDTYSRFLISPRRHIPKSPDKEERVRPYLASEAFQAFGGFLDERFREHDFQLGRRNCQNFLEKHFVLHRTNPLFKGRYATEDVSASFKQVAPRRKRPDQVSDDDQEKDFRPIIPLMGSARIPCDRPPWPQMPEQNLALLETGIRNRINGVVAKLINEQLSSRFLNWIAQHGWRWLERRRGLATRLRENIAASLYWSEQIEPEKTSGLLPTTRQEYAVLGALTDPAWDFRTAKGIAKEFNARQGQTAASAAGVGEAEIAEILERFKPVIVKARGRRKKTPAYTLKRRRPELANVASRLFAGAKGAKIDDPT